MLWQGRPAMPILSAVDHWVFGRQAGALREILQHRMRESPKSARVQSTTFYWFTVAQDPHAPGFDAPEHAQDFQHLHLVRHITSHSCLRRSNLSSSGRNETPRLDCRVRRDEADSGRNGARARPQHNIRPPEVFGTFAPENTPACNVPRHARLAVADQLRSSTTPSQPISAPPTVRHC